MKTPLLSILIASIPSRMDKARALYENLLFQAGKNDHGTVEILLFLDNKQRSVGMKRQSLLDLSRGEYIVFVDDDDEVSDLYVTKIVQAILVDNIARGAEKPDVIVWPILVSINGAQKGIVLPSIAHINKPIPEYEPPVTYRPPHHLCCWKREIAIKGVFPDKQHGEDFDWARQVWPHAKTEKFVELALYHYRWDKAVTEAEPV